MNPSLITALSWASWVGAAVGVIVYFAVLLRRPQWVRLLNGSGLFFSGAALSQTPALLNRTDLGAVAYPTVIVTVLLLAAVIAQAAAVLRNRQAWDGVDRRSDGRDPNERRERSDRRDERDRRGPDRRSGQSDDYWDRADRREGGRRDQAAERRTGPRRGDDPADGAS